MAAGPGVHLYPTKINHKMDTNQNTSLFQLNLDAQNSYTLRSAASWSKVLGVASMIMGIIFIIFGIIAQQAISRYDGYDYDRGGMSAGTLGNLGLVLYVLMGLVFIISGVFAMNAGNKINQGLKNSDQAALSSGFANARNFFALWAILTILSLILVLISLLSLMGQ
jgi:hypothetical protein